MFKLCVTISTNKITPKTKMTDTPPKMHRPFLISWLMICPNPGITIAEQRGDNKAFFMTAGINFFEH